MEAAAPQIVFLKLGGSLITDKNTPMTPHLEVIDRLASEIVAGCRANPSLRLVIGHGSGSFGHVVAHKYATYQGSRTPQQWRGFAEVWQAARMLNQIVIESLHTAGLPVIAFPPSASIITDRRNVIQYNLEPLQQAITTGLIPVVNGDVVFDLHQGSTILSTEDVFCYLAPFFHPRRILLAGLEPGVWADFPACTHLAPLITRLNLAQVAPGLSGSAAVDVTGGMAQKVSTMLTLASQVPDLEVQIFSGQQPGLLLQVLQGADAGTLLKA